MYVTPMSTHTPDSFALLHLDTFVHLYYRLYHYSTVTLQTLLSTYTTDFFTNSHYRLFFPLTLDSFIHFHY